MDEKIVKDSQGLAKDLVNDCISRHGVSAWLDNMGYPRLADTVMDENRFPPAQQWIPCSERLPEPNERVLVYTVANEYHVWDAMPYHGEGYEWEDEEGLYHGLYEVEMWLPLPEPYAERRQDG